MDHSQVQHIVQFKRPSGTYFEIGINAWLIMQQFAQHRIAMPEAGGVLLGRHLLDSSAIIVDAITTPTPGDRQARTHFYRDHERHQKAIDAAWHESKGDLPQF